MHAYIKLGGHQHRVEKDQVILAELTGHDAGKEFNCTDVLLVADGSNVKVGKPLVNGAHVKFKVLADVRGPKIRAFRYKRRTGYRRQWGHRQNLQKLQVVEIKG
ncbi:MAG: 50S ribosomal protein L21 [Leptospiraceae bacterium]|nr:50S ribosomal protein L21 [Leptospiraceae bacterium]MCB1315642.1 50S ribosomal protein L21 [Leptospiraceae bacterium]MCB1320770.1 50S ribosomal protein L21 [Leptospiraceae bacterium]